VKHHPLSIVFNLLKQCLHCKVFVTKILSEVAVPVLVLATEDVMTQLKIILFVSSIPMSPGKVKPLPPAVKNIASVNTVLALF
jgi:hypothetical protein